MNLTKEDARTLSVLVVVALLVGSAFAFIPVSAATNSSAALTGSNSMSIGGSSSGSIVGATAKVDYPILAGLNTLVTRTISINNPIGQPSITSVTISVPKAAVGSGSPTGIYASDSGIPGTPTVQTFGSGPWAVVYSATNSNPLIPGGASGKLALQFTTETTTTAAGAADPYAISVSVVDSTGATTNLNSVTVYETATTTLAVNNPSTLTETAGSLFTFSMTGTVDSGLPLVASVQTPTAAVKTTTFSPVNGTFTTTSSAESITVNDTLASASVTPVTNLILQVAGSGTADSADASSGVLSAAPTSAITIVAGSVSQLALTIGGTKTGHIINESSVTPNAVPIGPGGSAVTVSTTDKYGNAAPFGSSTITVSLTAVSQSGANPAQFGSTSTASTTYPYGPASGASTSASISIPPNTASASLSGSWFYYGPDYGATSYIQATASGTSLSAATSPTIKTYNLDSAAPAPTSSVSTPTVGKAFTLTATFPTTQAQAGLPVTFYISSYSGNTTDSLGSFSSGSVSGGLPVYSTTTSVSSGKATATASFTPASTIGTVFTFGVNMSMWVNTAPAHISYTTTAGTALGATIAGTLASLTVNAYFSNPTSGTFPLSKTTYGLTTNIIASGTLYIDAVATDANGNPVAVGGVTQVTVTTSAGTLTSAIINIPNGQSDFASGTSGAVSSGLGFAEIFTAPSTVGTTVTLTVTASGITGSDTITVVSAAPLLNVVPPSTVVANQLSTFTGTVNASLGVSGDTISYVNYTVGSGSTAQIAIGVSHSSFSFSVSLPSTTSNSVKVCTTDTAGSAPHNNLCVTLTVPQPAASKTFTNATSTPLTQVTLTGGPVAVNATFTNNFASSLTVIIVANVLNSQGAIILESTSVVTAAGGATVWGLPVIQGIPHGTYTVQVTVYSTAYVTFSSTYSTTVTV